MRLRYVLAFLLPILIFFILDQSLGREYYSFPNDNTSGQFGLAQNLFHGQFDIGYNHPAFFLILLQSLVALPVLGNETLDAFYWMGIGLNIGFAIIASLLVALFSNILRLPLYIPVMLSLTAISMPTVAALAPQIAIYSPLGILSPALALGLYVIVTSATNRQWVNAVVLALFGFFLANLFLVIPMIIGAAAGFVWLAYREGLDPFLSRLSPAPETRSWPKIGGLLAILIILSWNVLDIIRHATGLMVRESLTWLATVMAALIVLYLILRITVVWRAWWALLAPTAISWIISCNFFVLYWGRTAFGKMRNKGGSDTDPGRSFSEITETSDYWGFLTAWSWHWLPIVCIIFSVLILAENLKRKKDTTQAVFAVIFVVLSLFLTFVIVAGIIFHAPSDSPTAYGMMSRFITMSVIVVAFVIVMIEHSPSKFLRFGGLATVLMIVGLAFGDYVSAARTVMPIFNELENELQRAVDTHLVKDPRNNVICLRSEQPRPCATLYGFNNYRLEKSKAAFQKLSLRDGRISYAKNFAKACPDLLLCDSSTLFIGSPPNNIPDNKKIRPVVHEPLASNIAAFKLAPR
ncbi:MAG: hypothetical protein HN403_16960 [Rhodospirillales bacterium]|jgi:hypothetical protein|nr:hypothetical protein [Rhodospirillales bacterium]